MLTRRRCHALSVPIKFLMITRPKPQRAVPTCVKGTPGCGGEAGGFIPSFHFSTGAPSWNSPRDYRVHFVCSRHLGSDSVSAGSDHPLSICVLARPPQSPCPSRATSALLPAPSPSRPTWPLIASLPPGPSPCHSAASPGFSGACGPV